MYEYCLIGLVMLGILYLIFKNITPNDTQPMGQTDMKNAFEPDGVWQTPLPEATWVNNYFDTMEASEQDAGQPRYSQDMDLAEKVKEDVNKDFVPESYISYWKRIPQKFNLLGCCDDDNPDNIIVEMQYRDSNLRGRQMAKVVADVKCRMDAEGLPVVFIRTEADEEAIFKYRGFNKYRYFGHVDYDSLRTWILSCQS